MKEVQYRGYKIRIDSSYEPDWERDSYDFQIVFPGGEEDGWYCGYIVEESAFESAKDRIDGFIHSERTILKRYVRELENGTEANYVVPWVYPSSR